MDIHKKIREHISTLSDGALSDSDLELALAALQSADGQQAWDTYHRIGDVLRARATPELSDAFAEKLAARLALEAPPLRKVARAAPVPDKRGATQSMQQQGVAVRASGGEGAEVAAVSKAKPAVISVS